MRSLFALLILAVGLVATGCGPEKTPEEIEAAKYPPVRQLTPEEQKRAEELSQTRPPSGH